MNKKTIFGTPAGKAKGSKKTILTNRAKLQSQIDATLCGKLKPLIIPVGLRSQDLDQWITKNVSSIS